MSVAVIFTLAVAVIVQQTSPLAPALVWMRTDAPAEPLNIDSIVALDHGMAMLSGVGSEGVSLWWRDTSGDWSRQLLDESPTQLSKAGDRLIAYRSRSAAILALDDGTWRVTETITLPEDARSRQSSGRPSLLGTTDGILEMSLHGNVWVATRDARFVLSVADPVWGPGVERPFRSSCRPPFRSSPDVPPIAVADDRIVALVSSNPEEPFGIWPACEPLAWLSDNGTTWTFETTSLGENGNYVYDLAWWDGMFIAVGGWGIGQSRVWSSIDGAEWVDATPDTIGSVDLERVSAGPAGWVILGRDSLDSGPVGWTSVDASCWEPLPDRVRGSDAAVTREGILVVDRSGPDIWLGVPSGSSGACR